MIKENDDNPTNISGSEQQSGQSNQPSRREASQPKYTDVGKPQSQLQPQNQQPASHETKQPSTPGEQPSQQKEIRLSKLVEEHRRKRDLGRQKLANVQEKEQEHLLLDLQRKEKEMEREEQRIKMKQDIQNKRVTYPFFFSV